MKKIFLLLCVTAWCCSFGIVYADPSTTLDNLIVYPNPMQTYLGHTEIKFDNVTPSVHLQVFKINGELVFDQTINSINGLISWKGVNQDNQALASGLYLYLLKNNNNEMKRGKIVILR